MNGEIYLQVKTLQKEIEQKRDSILELRKRMKPEPVSDYTLKDREGKDVLLSSLFDERNELLIIHNMGKGCLYCTLWADGFNGFVLPLTDRMPFVLVSPDAPEVQKEFSASRGWKFNMLSAKGTSFTKDLNFENDKGQAMPGASALIRKEDKIYRTSYDSFGPGDYYCSVWHLFDLFPNQDNGWQPKYKYGKA